MSKVTFVRAYRTKDQKRGCAIDKSGKVWCGFKAHTTLSEIQHTAILNGAGICFLCDDLILEGWGCRSEPDGKRDVCDQCVILPRICIVDPKSEAEWAQLQKEFRHASFDYWRWHQEV